MKTRIMGVLSAILASICCIGPILLISVGLGSLGLSAVFGRYHWWFLGAGVLFIIIAWGYYFKEKKTCDLEGCQMKDKGLTKVILIIATGVVAFFILLNLYPYINKSCCVVP